MAVAAGNARVVGPFGGEGGVEWNDGVHTTIRTVILRVSKLIDSITIEYDDNGKSKWGPKHGASSGGIEQKIVLDYPEEFIIAFSGFLNSPDDDAVLQSLTIQTNKKKYGPYGNEIGNQNAKYFSTTPNYKGKVLGFFGRSGTYVDAIGAYLGPFSVGPEGGPGGDGWDDGAHTGVRQIVVHAGEMIDSVQFEYDDNGTSKWSPIHGKTGGNRYAVSLAQNEYLVKVTGYQGTWFAVDGIRSLTFHTNRRAIGPYGPHKADNFELSSSGGGKIVGFYGKSGDYLDSIGAYVF